jgi:capsular polysaccharide biosynthesis protein
MTPFVAVEDLPPTRITVPDYPPEPPRLGLFQAVKRSLPLVILPVLLLVAGAAAYGLLREPTYTTEARLNVGGLTLTQQSIDGYTGAVAQLAVAYSRAIDATGVVEPVARRLDLPPEEVASRISATPIQGSPVIRVIATGKDSAQTRRLADGMADSLVDYAMELNAGEQRGQRLLRRYVAASRDYRRASLEAARFDSDDERRRPFQVRADIARLKQTVSGVLYQQAVAGQATLNLVQKLAPAAPPSSDRDEVLQQALAGGLIAGLLIGIGLAVWRTNRLTARRLGL